MEQDVKTLRDYLQMFRRRKTMIVVPMLLLLAVSVIVALALPPVYRSEATILIEQQHIPTDLVKSTVVSFADERIKQIQQKLMTVDNLNMIIDKFGLYPEQKLLANASDLADEFRENTQLELINADVISQGRNTKATLAFTLSFDDKNPVMAQKVVNELVTLFLNENVRSRTQRAEETTKFLQEEAEKFKMEIQKIENQIAEYKGKYSESLPELLPVNLAAISRIESTMQQLQMQEKMLDERRISLRTQLAVTSPIVTVAGENNVATAPESLPVLQEEYERLLSKYSSKHPDVKALKRKIDNFEDSPAQANINNPVYLQLQSEMDIAGVELQNIQKQRAQLSEKLKQLEVNVSQTHQVERGYYELMRDLDNHKAKYNELKAKYLEAKLSQTLEEEQKAEKFSLLEPPRVPEKPEKPNRIKILFMGLIFSIGGGLGVGYLVEMMDDSIRGSKALTGITGMEPLVVIPYIKNQEDIDRSRKHTVYFAALAIALLLGMIAAVHFLYKPLDLLMDKVLHRISML